MCTALLGKFDFRKIRQATYSKVLVQITAVSFISLLIPKVTEKALGELHSSIRQSTACINRAAETTIVNLIFFLDQLHADLKPPTCFKPAFATIFKGAPAFVGNT